jgi:hypothetical protein
LVSVDEIAGTFRVPKVPGTFHLPFTAV